jgi:hypothetical protein
MLIILWQVPGASIPRQRLGTRLLTMLCKRWLRIPTFPTQRNRGWIVGTLTTYHYYATSEWNRCICGNEYIPLLVIDAAMQKLVTDSNVPTQRNRGRILVLSLQPFVNQLLASLRRGKTESVIRWPPRREDIGSPPALGQRVVRQPSRSEDD